MAEKKNHSHELHEKCIATIKEIGENFIQQPETIAEFLEFSSKFYKYSPDNTKLIYAQNPNATFVQSYTSWKKMGYPPVKKGSGLLIRRPERSIVLEVDGQSLPIKFATKEQRNKFENGEIKGHIHTSFKPAYTFDISSTEFPPKDYPKIFSVGYPSETHDKICKGLCDFAKTKLNVGVSYDDLNSIGVRGIYNPMRKVIKVNSILNDTQKLCTLAHEIGHALENHGNRQVSGMQAEFEADAISIMIQSNYNIPLSDARKEHLAKHYEAFKNELMVLEDDYSIELLDQKLNEVLDNTYSLFKENIDELNQCVSEYISHEQLNELLADEITEAAKADIAQQQNSDYYSEKLVFDIDEMTFYKSSNARPNSARSEHSLENTNHLEF